ncbi:MAG: bifunctional 5,10-methylenetetrahydrofolate dehydrogenase/5,10-methenyltetrahydrofolate cyclohydrolase [Bacteroidota bacterium]
MKLIDGKGTAEAIKLEIAEIVNNMKQRGERAPHLAAILVGNDPASETYVSNKIKTCKDIGFESSLIHLDASISEEDLLKSVQELNNNPEVDGFIVQLPLPKHINVHRVTEAILPEKDVDGFHPINVGRMSQQMPCYLPATPKGIMQLLETYKIDTIGKHCVVIGRSNIVGTPMSVLLSRNQYPGNCTVTICHSKTPNIADIIKQGDIVIAAIGQPLFVKAHMIKEGAVVIDVGMSRIASDVTKSGFRLAGDVDFDEVAPKCSYITPVPGGVGPMTIIGLVQNTLMARQKKVRFN